MTVHPPAPELAVSQWFNTDTELNLADLRGEVVVTKHGRPAVVMLSVEDLESLEETLEILSDRQLMDEISEGRAELAAGKGEVLTRDEVLAQVRAE